VSSASIGYRSRYDLPRLGHAIVAGEVLLDTNVFINALARRDPPELTDLLADLPDAFVSGPTLAELNWPRGRLDPAHPNTTAVLLRLDQAISRIDPAKVLAPSPGQWARAGELAGRAARAVAGGSRSIRTAFDRIELINDAATAIVALDVGLTIVTQDGDFDLFLQLEPELRVVFYD
jgi:predicted nucleic acid-binding protein